MTNQQIKQTEMLWHLKEYLTCWDYELQGQQICRNSTATTEPEEKEIKIAEENMLVTVSFEPTNDFAKQSLQ